MAMTFLKKAKAFQPTQSVKYLLHSHLNGPDPARPMSRLHASELTKPEGFCPRHYALADATKTKPKDNWLTTSEEVTFHIGRVLQDAVVNWFADMGKAFCHWKCQGCGHNHEFQLRPMKCVSCGSKNFWPKEVRFESAETGASCGVDMLVALGEKKLKPIELKTMDKDQFKDLKGPLAEHRLRTNLYLRIMAESSSPWSNTVNHEKATVLYISKGGWGCADPQLKEWGLKEQFSPFKEFEISRDDSQTDDLADRARTVKEFRAGKVGMPFGICATALVPRAMKCPLRAACFSGEHPPVHDWAAKD